jgi:transcriptional regulator with XRE-family HTH domain
MVMNIGEWVQLMRQERKLDIRAFSTRTGLDIGTISRVENGRAQATLATVVRMCERLGVSVEEFIGMWQGKSFLGFESSTALRESTIPTLQDVHAFLIWARKDPSALCAWLADSFNRIAALQQEAPPLFVPEELEKFLFGSWYRLEVQYPPNMAAEEILAILKQGGVLILSDIGTYLKQLLHKELVSEGQRDAALRGLTRLETGSVERVKMIDVLLLDEQLEQEGKIVAMYWRVYAFQDEMLRLQASSVGQPASEVQNVRIPGREVKLTSVFITICRWLQLGSQEDAFWMKDLRVRFGHPSLLQIEEPLER